MGVVLLVGGLALLLSAAVAADPSYQLIQGERWRGVVIGDEPPRTRDRICYDRRCYPISRLFPLTEPMRQRYGLTHYSFGSLAELPQVERRGEQLLLPPDIGRRLYEDARRDAWQEQRESRRIRWPGRE